VAYDGRIHAAGGRLRGEQRQSQLCGAPRDPGMRDPIPAAALAAKVVQVGNCSGRDVDKFETVGLTAAPARRVAAPLVVECFANLECRVADTRLVNKYNLFVLEALQAWRDPAQGDPKTIHHRGYGAFVVDGETIKLESEKP